MHMHIGMHISIIMRLIFFMSVLLLSFKTAYVGIITRFFLLSSLFFFISKKN